MVRRITLLVVVAAVLIFVLPSVISYWELLPYANYKIGDEIKGFPVDEMAITITNCYTTTQNLTGFNPIFRGAQFVVLNVTITNLSEQDRYFYQNDDFLLKLRNALSKYLFLEYKVTYDQSQQTGEGITWPKIQDHHDEWWGITVTDTSEFSGIAANQSVDGAMFFKIDGFYGTYTPADLVCRSANVKKPLFTVNLQQP